MQWPEHIGKVICGDCLEVLKEIPDGVVQCCVTSPPYWNLRDYGTAQWEGGDPECDHIEQATGMSDKNTLGPDKHLPPTNAANTGRILQYKDVCLKCGARRIDNQIGLESTPEEYVAKMVEVFREVRRVLRDDGTLWLNLGDTYAGSWGAMSHDLNGKAKRSGNNERPAQSFIKSKRLPRKSNRRDKAEVIPGRWGGGNMPAVNGLKPKDRVGIPHMIVFALRADDWWWRDEIVWNKPNPMPESVTDRCTKAHEFVFMLSKSATYYYDQDAAKEPLTESSIARLSQDVEHQEGSDRIPGKTNGPMKAVGSANGRNRRSVWTIATQPSGLPHFAQFPEKLVEPPIMAGSKAGDIVLDPFGGLGTVGLVAKRHGRRYISIDLSSEYSVIAEDRLRQCEMRLE